MVGEEVVRNIAMLFDACKGALSAWLLIGNVR